MDENIILSAKGLDLWYGPTQALKGVSMDIPEKQVTALIGPSGCGKSTFLKTLDRMNDLVPGIKITGSVQYRGQEIYAPNVDVTWLRKQIGMVFQKPNPFPMSIYDNVAYGPRTHGIKSKSRLDDIVEKSLQGAAIWDEVKDRLKKSALGLSGGQQNPGIPHGENLFQRGDGGKISQMNGTIAFAVCPGDQPLLDIVVDHGGGESLPFVKVDQLPGHIGNDLVHIQRNIRQFLPGSGTLALQALL